MTASLTQLRLSYVRIWSLPSTLVKCLLEARPAVLGIHLLRFAAGAAIGARLTGHLRTGIGLTDAAAWVLAIFAVYLFNGVTDIHEDRVNGSRRPIAAGTLSSRTAASVAATAALLALAAAAATGIATTAAVAAVLAVGWQYSARPGLLKRRPAGTAVAGAAMGFLAYVAGFSSQADAVSMAVAPGALAFAIAMSAWMAFVGAPAKDLSDIPGDAAAGRRTIPVLWGERPTRLVIVGAAAAIVIGFALAAQDHPDLLVAPAVALGAGAAAIAFVCVGFVRVGFVRVGFVRVGPVRVGQLGLRPISTGTRARRRLPYRVFMLTQYAANAGLLVAVLTH